MPESLARQQNIMGNVLKLRTERYAAVETFAHIWNYPWSTDKTATMTHRVLKFYLLFFFIFKGHKRSHRSVENYSGKSNGFYLLHNLHNSSRIACQDAFIVWGALKYFAIIILSQFCDRLIVF